MRIINALKILGGLIVNGASTFTGYCTFSSASQSGSYTPTITGVANVASTTSAVIKWLRIGNTVSCGFRTVLTPTAGATVTDLRLSLPVASAFTGTSDLCGVGLLLVNRAGVTVYADIASDEVFIRYTSNSTSSETLFGTFVYEVK